MVLPCQVESKEGVLQWTRDGFGLGQYRSLPGFPRMNMVGEDSSRDWNLEIDPVRLEDQATYQCQVTSKTGSSPPIRSTTARLTVLIPSGPPSITNGSTVTLTEGIENTLVCEAEGGKPAAQVGQNHFLISIVIGAEICKVVSILSCVMIRNLNLIFKKLFEQPDTGKSLVGV